MKKQNTALTQLSDNRKPISTLPLPLGEGEYQLLPFKSDLGEGFKRKSVNLDELQIQGDPEALRLFKQQLFFALLNKDPGKYKLIDQVIEQAKEKGLSYVLCKVSSEARKFYSLSRQVGAERYRATAFMRLQPVDQYKVLMGEFELRHNTAELIMLHFMKRFPQYKIMLVFGEDVYIGKDKEIFKEKIERKKITLPHKVDEFERYWFAFYKSQYLPERRNLRYLKRMIPKKYWRWVTELKEFGLT
jgi:probable DNA metabolism protein